MYFITPQSKKAQWTPTCLRWVGLLLVLLVSYSSFAQKQPSDKKNPKKEGELLFSARNYSAAVPFFLEQQSKDPKDFDLKYGVYIGNSVDDMQAAQAAGIDGIAITTSASDAALKEAGAQLIINSMSELEKVFHI